MYLPKSSTEKCKDCYRTLPSGSATVNCKICKQHLCLLCSKQSKNRANGPNSEFYRQYVNTCDTCIWLDIG